MNTDQKKVFNRINDFIKFHNESCKADTIVGQLKKYCEIMQFTEEQKENAVLIYSLTYSIPSTIVIMLKMQELTTNPKKFWKENKEKLIFQSDRKYVKINDKFLPAFFEFDRNIFKTIKKLDKIDMQNIVLEVEKCYFFARFSAFLFIEAYSCIFDKEIVNNKLDWLNGSTVTSGLLNVLGLDNAANVWDKTHNLNIDVKTFDLLVEKMLNKVSIGKDISVMETNLCAYRKLFKGSRYLGYYSDRVLEELNQTIKNYPEYLEQLSVLFIAREHTIPNKYLGEKHNWNGIRKEMKKYYLNTGKWEW